MTQPDILPLLQQTFGFQVELVDARILNQHEDYWVLIAELNDPATTVVVKIAGENAPLAHDFERTAMLHQRIAVQTRVPIAEILAVGVFDSWQYLIKEHIPGEPWVNVYPQLDEQQKYAAHRQIGQAVREIHGITFPAFGEIGGADTSNFREALEARAKLSIKNPRLRDIMLRVIADNEALFRGIKDAHLCHEDLHHHNVLFRDVGGSWELATILDFEKAWAGHAEIDLARMEFWYGMVGDGFWKGYGAIPEPLYAHRRPVYQLLWCLEYAASTERHLSDTQWVCEQLGIPAITGFD